MSGDRPKFIRTDLGFISLTNIDFGTSLCASCSVHLSAPLSGQSFEEDIVDVHPGSLASTWICRGPGCKIAFRVGIEFPENGQPEVQILNGFFKVLVDAMTLAELWNQLLLETSLLYSSPDEGSFAIGLRHREGDTLGSDSGPHKTNSTVPAAAVQPPRGVQSYGITDIDICLEFTHDRLPNISNDLSSTAVDLVDNALRLFILSDKVRRSRGVRIYEDERQCSMSDLSPALFRPKYLTAISKISTLIPTVAQALEKIRHDTNSTSLRDKIDRLCQKWKDDNDLTAMIEENDSLSSAMRAHTSTGSFRTTLWDIAQRQLRDRPLLRGLIPLKSPRSDEWECSLTPNHGPDANDEVDVVSLYTNDSDEVFCYNSMTSCQDQPTAQQSPSRLPSPATPEEIMLLEGNFSEQEDGESIYLEDDNVSMKSDSSLPEEEEVDAASGDCDALETTELWSPNCYEDDRCDALDSCVLQSDPLTDDNTDPVSDTPDSAIFEGLLVTSKDFESPQYSQGSCFFLVPENHFAGNLLTFGS